MRNLLIAMIVLLYLILGWLFNQDHKRCCTNVATEVIPAAPAIIQKTGPLLFGFNSSTPILSDAWPAYRDSLSTLISASTTLEITGWYCTNLNPAEDEGLGRKRAEEVRKLFDENLWERITVETRGIDCSDERININDIAASFSQKKSTEHVKEVADKTLIYFPYNSTKRINNKEVESYLDDVAASVLQSGKSIRLTGHTDNIGSDEANMALGNARAESVRQYLISKGVSPDKITVISKGETEPIADNSTEQGRAQNRRTELQVI